MTKVKRSSAAIAVTATLAVLAAGCGSDDKKDSG